MSSFDDDFAAAESMFAEAFGDAVIYVAGATEIAWTAEVVLSKHEVTDDYGATTVVVSRDYIGDASALGVVPVDGHRIMQTIGGVLKTFEVMPIAGKKCWESADPDGRQIVVRTKETT